MRKPVIEILMGDSVGIGSEIVAKALADKAFMICPTLWKE